MESKENTPSPEEVARSREGILKAAGSWKDIDTEAFKAYINNRRQKVDQRDCRTRVALRWKMRLVNQ
jgi:hypothetical protein